MAKETIKKKIITKKHKLVTTALDLFCTNGFHATGVDTILKHANISKATLYTYFKTKDDLIIACLKHYHDEFVSKFINKIENEDITAKEKILQIFNKLYNLTKKEQMVRCVFINASAEFSDYNHPIHKVAIEHKTLFQNYIKKLAVQAKITDALHFTRICTILLEGALVMAQVSGDKKYYKNAIITVKEMLR